MIPIAGFLIDFEDGFLGNDGQLADIDDARIFETFEDALLVAGNDEKISEFVVANGKRELAYEPDA